MLGKLGKTSARPALNFGRLKNKEASASSKSTKDDRAEMLRQRSRRKSGAFDSPVAEHIKTFNPKAGDHDVRILPPQWEGAKHFAVDLWMHWGIGADSNSYLCPAKMNSAECPLCDERIRAQKDNEPELAKALRPGERTAFWIIDRKNEKEGPMVWLCPSGVEKAICGLAEDKKTGEVFYLDDLEEGYDVSFTVTGEQLRKKYEQIQVARRPSPVSDSADDAEEWIKYISENPIPDILVFQDPDYLKNALEGGVRMPDEDDEDDKSRKGGKERERPRIGDRGSSSSARPRLGAKKEEPESTGRDEGGEMPTWAEVHGWEQEVLEEAVDQLKLDPKDFSECSTVEELQDKFCELCRIEKPKPAGTSTKGMGLKERLAALRKDSK